MNSFQDIKHVFYINLESRPDRKHHVENELSKLGLKGTRFNAIKLKNGAIGCSMSHLKVLENAQNTNLDHVVIVEDDITFLQPALFKTQLDCFLKNNKDFDVALIAGNNLPPFKVINSTCVKVSKCQTTTGYIVNKHYYATLIQNIRDGIAKLLKDPEKHVWYAIDKYWFRLQEKHNWFLITPLTVIQRADYSDIEKKSTNYAKGMLDLDKVQYFKDQQRQFEKYKSLHMNMHLI